MGVDELLDVITMAALPPDAVAWDEDVDSGLLCHLLFGVAADATHGPEMLRFRCGPGARGCHNLNMPHYGSLRDVRCASAGKA